MRRVEGENEDNQSRVSHPTAFIISLQYSAIFATSLRLETYSAGIVSKMPLTLAGLPTEIVAKITSLVYQWEDVASLFFTGDTALASKLRNGGIKSVEFSSFELRQGTLNYLAFLPLEEVFINGSYEDKPIHELVRHLPSNLRSLNITAHLERLLVESDTLNLALGPTATFPTAFAPWNVAKQFPQLKSLTLRQYATNDEEAYDPFTPAFWSSFFLGLPRTLADLIIHSTTIPIIDWKSLPPGLATLEAYMYGNLEVPANLCDSLTSLKVDLDQPMPEPLCIGSLKSESQKKAWISQNVQRFVCPPNLTRLRLHCLTSLPMATLPSTLTHLKWKVSDPSGSFDLFRLLLLVPTSLTQLKVSGHGIKNSLCLPIMIPKRFPKLKSLDIREHSLGYAVDEDAWLSALLHAMPSLESLWLGSTWNGLQPHHLPLLNPSLRVLSTKCTLSCFEQVDKEIPFQKALPALEKFELVGPNIVIWSDETLAGLPKTLTSLNIGASSITTDQLLLLPPKITKLQASNVSVVCNENFEKLITPFPTPRNAPTALAHPTDSHPAKPIKTTAIHIASKYGLEFPEVGAAHDSRRFCLSSSGRGIQLKWSTLLPLVFATRLRVGTKWVDSEHFTPTALPHLIYLKIDGDVPSNMQLGLFDKLETLIFHAFAASTAGCPPNLTKLKLEVAKFPESFLPLPSSLTSLRFRDGSAPYQLFDSLPNLQEFGLIRNPIYAKDVPLFSDFLRTTHPNIRSLHIGDLVEPSILNSIQSNFPSLSHLQIHGETNMTNIRLLLAALPNVKVKGGELTEQPDLGELALRGGFEHGTIRPLYSKWIGDFMTMAFWRIMPDYEYNFTCPYSSFNTDSWAQFAPFLARDVTSLDFGSTGIINLPANFAELMPPSITHLRLGVIVWKLDLSSLTNLHKLEGSITRSRDKDALIGEFVSRLPRNLKILWLTGAHTLISPSFVADLPPSLTHLHFPGNFEAGSLALLPTSLVYLGTWEYALDSSDLHILPASLRFFYGFITRQCAQVLLDPSYSGNLSWVTTKAPLEAALRLFVDDPNGNLDFVKRLKQA